MNIRLILKLIQAILEVLNEEIERKKRNEMEDSDKIFHSSFGNTDRIY